jgi:alkylation response protein AidB-like acyl-CoA dehydrogenase
VRFAFTDQQVEFRDAVRQVLDRECTTADLRAAYDRPTARGPRWATLAELGVTGIEVPEEHGGLGLGLVDLVLLLEEAGRVALPEPLAESAALAAPLLSEFAGDDGPLADRIAPWLEAIAGGRLAAAVGEPPASRSSPTPVAGADGADLVVLLVPGGGEGSGGPPEIHVLGPEPVDVAPIASLDPTRRLGAVRWTPGPGTRLVSGPDAAAAIGRTTDRAAVATAAQLLGLSDRMVTMAAEYAKARHQFGKPIGGFQAVKHLLAGARVKLEFARPVVSAAAWSLDQGDPGASRAASMAKATASDAATEAARVSLQVHGAIGYTWECDLHLFLKRAWALAEAWGSAAEHRQRVAPDATPDRPRQSPVDGSMREVTRETRFAGNPPHRACS